MRATAPDDACDCRDGVVIGQGYGADDMPAGAVPVQACWDCEAGAALTDEDAAAAYAGHVGGDYGYAPGHVDQPGDWWVSVPVVWRCRFGPTAATAPWAAATKGNTSYHATWEQAMAATGHPVLVGCLR